MGGDLNASGPRQRRRAHPAAHAANTHEIGHDVVAGFGADRFVKDARPIKIFAELHRRLEFAGELRVAGEVVVNDRLLEPVESLVVERVAARQRIAESESLVEIDHELDVIARAIATLADRREVVGEALAAEPKLQGLEAALRDKLACFLRQSVDAFEPETVAVVSGDRP